MIVRHHMFYSGAGQILQEMGWEQSFLSVILIPVTASFGCFAHFRTKLAVSSRSYIRVIVIGAIPVILSIFFDVGIGPFEYRFTEESRRPPLLILLPIGISLLVRMWFEGGHNILGFVSLSSLVLGWILSQSFVSYYALLFLLFWQLSSFFFQLPCHIQKIAELVSFPIMTALIYAFSLVKFPRVPFWFEFVWVTAYLGCLLSIARLLSHKFYPIQWFPSILYVYASQAFVFNAWYVYLQIGRAFEVFSIILIFSLSILMAKLVSLFERRVSERYRLLTQQ